MRTRLAERAVRSPVRPSTPEVHRSTRLAASPTAPAPTHPALCAHPPPMCIGARASPPAPPAPAPAPVHFRGATAHAPGGPRVAASACRGTFGPTSDDRRLLPGNPLLDERRRLEHAGRGDPEREALVARYAYGIPGDEALDAIAAFAPHGVVELGAGRGYWAALLTRRGVDVVAYDRTPPAHQWHPVQAGDERAVERHADRTLLLVWPTWDEAWPGEAAARFHAAGGARLVFVGEGPGGLTGDPTLHALLGAYGACLACTYGVADAPCLCDVEPLWRAIETVPVPQWDGVDDACTLHLRRDAPDRHRRRRRPPISGS